MGERSWDEERAGSLRSLTCVPGTSFVRVSSLESKKRLSHRRGGVESHTLSFKASGAVLLRYWKRETVASGVLGRLCWRRESLNVHGLMA